MPRGRLAADRSDSELPFQLRAAAAAARADAAAAASEANTARSSLALARAKSIEAKARQRGVQDLAVARARRDLVVSAADQHARDVQDAADRFLGVLSGERSFSDGESSSGEEEETSSSDAEQQPAARDRVRLSARERALLEARARSRSRSFSRLAGHKILVIDAPDLYDRARVYAWLGDCRCPAPVRVDSARYSSFGRGRCVVTFERSSQALAAMHLLQQREFKEGGPDTTVRRKDDRVRGWRLAPA